MPALGRPTATSPRTIARTNNAGKSQSNAAPSTPNQRGFSITMRSNESLNKSQMPAVTTVR